MRQFFIMDDEERILDAEQWQVEAQAVISDVKNHVLDIKVSDEIKLRSSNQTVYLNLTTLENLKFCVRLSSSGFSIVANQHDLITNGDAEDFETIYGLLNSISPKFRESFGNNLLDKLKAISEEQEHFR